MHMADALLSPAVAATMYVASGVAAGISVHKLKKDNNAQKLPTMAVVAALVFAGQMINYTIPGTGSSGHLCGGMMLSALLGPLGGFLSMMVILTIQCLLFADGGLMALGANCWNMAFYGCFAGYYLVWKPIMQSNLFSKSGNNNSIRMKIISASVIGCIITLQMGAFSVVAETTFSGITELPFVTFCAIMQPIHLAIGLVEGLITAAVLAFVFESRPELLQNVPLEHRENVGFCSLKTTLIVLAAVTALVGGILSPFASANPDGLEWSLFGNTANGYSKNMALNEEHYGIESNMAETASSVQGKTAILPDYNLPNGDGKIGTPLSGLVGSGIVAAAAFGICAMGGFFRKKKTT